MKSLRWVMYLALLSSQFGVFFPFVALWSLSCDLLLKLIDWHFENRIQNIAQVISLEVQIFFITWLIKTQSFFPVKYSWRLVFSRSRTKYNSLILLLVLKVVCDRPCCFHYEYFKRVGWREDFAGALLWPKDTPPWRQGGVISKFYIDVYQL